MNIKYKSLSLLLATIILFNTTLSTFANETTTISSSTTNATVENVNNSTYSVTIPSYISTGELSPTEENKVGYSLFVDNYDIKKGQVVVSANSSAKLVHTSDKNESLSVSNSFTKETIIENRMLEGSLSIDPNEVRTALKGDYEGTITFDFEYQYYSNLDSEVPEFKWDTVTESSTALDVTGGIYDYIESLDLTENETINIVLNQITVDNPSVNSNSESYFSEDDLENINKSNEEAISNTQQYIKENFENSIIKYYYSFKIVKEAEEGDSKNQSLITDTGDYVLELKVGYDSKMVGADQKIILLRDHDGVVENFTQLPGKPTELIDGTFYVEDNFIYIYSSKYSVYSVGVADATSTEEDSTTPDETPDVTPDETPDVTPDETPDTSEPLEDLPDGEYTADVSMLQFYNTDLYSMCDVLFYENADVVVKGDNATVTLYVIDPIPNFSSYGTPISDVWFEYEGKTYNATVSSYSGTKYFEKDGTFISESGNYTVSKLTVTLPKQAILDAYKPSLVCSAFVDAVMNSRQPFYVILQMDGVSGDAELPEVENEDNGSSGGSSGGGTSSGGSSSGGTSNNNTSGSDTSTTELTDGTYNAGVTMLQYYNTTLKSMCDVLFHNNAEVVVSGDEATLTVYVIDPIPNFSSYGTPISDIWFEYEGSKYTATVSSSNETKYFDGDGSFISENGNYSVSKLTVTLPKQAILDAYQPSLVCSAYVDAVMMSRQSFYVILEVDGVTNASGSLGSSGNTSEEVYTDGEMNDLSLEGTYSSEVDFKKEADFESFSMCDTLFYSYSDIIVKDDMATVILYIIDPIPGYESYGTPITEVSFEYEGVTYLGTIDSSNQEEKYFPADDRFIFTSDDYYTSRITVTIPVEAVETSQNASLKCTGFVNAVMNSYQTFYVVFSNVEWVSDSTDGSLSANTQNDTVSNQSGSNNGSGTSGEAKDVQSVTIYGSSNFVWILFGIIMLTIIAFVGYLIYKRRNR